MPPDKMLFRCHAAMRADAAMILSMFICSIIRLMRAYAPMIWRARLWRRWWWLMPPAIIDYFERLLFHTMPLFIVAMFYVFFDDDAWCRYARWCPMPPCRHACPPSFVFHALFFHDYLLIDYDVVARCRLRCSCRVCRRYDYDIEMLIRATSRCHDIIWYLRHCRWCRLRRATRCPDAVMPITDDAFDADALFIFHTRVLMPLLILFARARCAYARCAMPVVVAIYAARCRLFWYDAYACWAMPVDWCLFRCHAMMMLMIRLSATRWYY